MLVYGSYIQVPSLGQQAGQGEGVLLNVSSFWFILSLKEDITFVESYALVKYACLLLQIRLHMNPYTLAHICPMNICGMISFGGLLSE